MRIGEVLTMDEYIKREAAIRALLNDAPEQVGYSREDAADCIRYMDSADVAPVRHGMWETIDASTWRWSHDGAKPVHRVKYRHNECGRVVQRKEPYCPNCGAKMLEG